MISVYFQGKPFNITVIQVYIGLTLFWGAPKSLKMMTAAMKLKDTPWKESYDQPRKQI